MIAKLLSLLSPGQSRSDADPVALATGLLLAKAGMMDGHLDDSERQVILDLLKRRFSLTSDQAQDLFRRAEDAANESVDLFSHTKIVKDALSYEERLDIIEMLWEVVYADGHLHDFEANLMRRVTGLLYVEDGDSGLARKRVLDRLGLS
jgi:uncharacterized tellurite resistance protein B-like protein